MSLAAVAEGVRERFVTFPCGDTECVGVLSLPAAVQEVPRRGRIGVILVVGGPQYRAGSHRQIAIAARAFARGGFPALRFDVRGMGDSEGTPRSFEAVGDDIAAAIAAIRAEAGVDRCVLWGLCDAATAALTFAPAEPAVAGVVALNPWARTAVTEASARVRHHYRDRMLSLRFWRRLFSGQVAWAPALAEAARALATAGSAERVGTGGFLGQLQACWEAFGRPVLLILAGRDRTAQEFEAWAGAAASRRALLHNALTTVVRIAEADHTFSRRAWAESADDATLAWLERLDRPA